MSTSSNMASDFMLVKPCKLENR